MSQVQKAISTANSTFWEYSSLRWKFGSIVEETQHSMILVWWFIGFNPIIKFSISSQNRLSQNYILYILLSLGNLDQKKTKKLPVVNNDKTKEKGDPPRIIHPSVDNNLSHYTPNNYVHKRIKRLRLWHIHKTYNIHIGGKVQCTVWIIRA